MDRLITRSQLGRVTNWYLTHHRRCRCHYYPSPPPYSSTTIASFAKHCSTVTTSSSSSENREKTLPENIVKLICSSSAEGGYCTVYLVGVCHGFKKSCFEVEQIIKEMKPEIVYLELCRKRQGILTTKHLKEITNKDIISVILKKGENPLTKILRMATLAIAKQLNIIPGSECRVAYEEVRKYGGKAVFGDRPIEVTMKRLWRKMTLPEMIRLCSPHSREDPLIPFKTTMDLYEAIENMDMDTANRLTQELKKISPFLPEILIHERDRFMSNGLLTVARKNRCVVAVVGKGHLEGIKKNWLKPISVEEHKELMSIPPHRLHTMSVKTRTCVGIFIAWVAVIWIVPFPLPFPY